MEDSIKNLPNSTGSHYLPTLQPPFLKGTDHLLHFGVAVLDQKLVVSHDFSRILLFLFSLPTPKSLLANLDEEQVELLIPAHIARLSSTTAIKRP